MLQINGPVFILFLLSQWILISWSSGARTTEVGARIVGVSQLVIHFSMVMSCSICMQLLWSCLLFYAIELFYYKLKYEKKDGDFASLF
jgi:hypothetical protein